MNAHELIDYYKGLSKAARAIEASKQLVNHWKTHRIPSHWQLRIEAATNGVLRADEKAKELARVFSNVLQREAA